MKKTACLLFALMLAGELPLLAQNKKEKREKVTTIKLIQKENGEEIIVDTTFINADQSAIDAFLKEKGIKNSSVHTIAPLPPIPPHSPRMPMPPLPPEPPTIDDEMQGLRYQYNLNEDDDEINLKFNDELAPIMQSLEEIKEVVKRSLRGTKLTEEEVEKVLNEMEKELKYSKQLHDRPIHKREQIIIKKKTGELDQKHKDSDLGSNFRFDEPIIGSFAFSSTTLEEPIIINTAFDNNSFTTRYRYSYSDVERGKHQKIKLFIKRLKDKILD